MDTVTATVIGATAGTALFREKAGAAGVLVFAIGRKGSERSMRLFHPVYHVLAAGVALSFLTGDLFTLFVGFEVMLMASYVLLTHRADAKRLYNNTFCELRDYAGEAEYRTELYQLAATIEGQIRAFGRDQGNWFSARCLHL